jgi:hypothetical protein
LHCHRDRSCKRLRLMFKLQQTSCVSVAGLCCKCHNLRPAMFTCFKSSWRDFCAPMPRLNPTQLLEQRATAIWKDSGLDKAGCRDWKQQEEVVLTLLCVQAPTQNARLAALLPVKPICLLPVFILSRHEPYHTPCTCCHHRCHQVRHHLAAGAADCAMAGAGPCTAANDRGCALRERREVPGRCWLAWSARLISSAHDCSSVLVCALRQRHVGRPMPATRGALQVLQAF